WMAAKELAPESTPQTAMKTTLIRGCLRVRSTRGSLRSRKWWWNAADPSLAMGRSPGRSLSGRRPGWASERPPSLLKVTSLMRDPYVGRGPDVRMRPDGGDLL